MLESVFVYQNLNKKTELVCKKTPKYILTASIEIMMLSRGQVLLIKCT